MSGSRDQGARPPPSLSLTPGRSLGPLILGSCIYECLSIIKLSSHTFSSFDITYSSSNPVGSPIAITLPNNGIRIRFDGAEQRLRLIEILDFNKMRFVYNNYEIYKPSEVTTSGGPSAGPSYRSLIKLFGPTYPGEYLPPHTHEDVSAGTFILSYPGLAFAFPVEASAWMKSKDPQSLLSSSATSPARFMCIFHGRSWPDRRKSLFEPTISRSLRPRTTSNAYQPEPSNAIEFARVYGEGRIELVRPSGASFWLVLSETTPQDLISELGAPDAIYRKNDRRVAIHKTRSRRSSRVDDDSDNDNSLPHTDTDDSEIDEDPAMDANNKEIAAAEHFYNYFRLGFDILISEPTSPSAPSPSMPEAKSLSNIGNIIPPAKNILTATKIILHGNIPGSWSFNRYSRCRWTLEHVPTARETEPLTSETKFNKISSRLKEVFRSTYASEEEARAQQRPMGLNRDWGESPSSSIELLGGWEEDVASGKNGDFTSSSSEPGISSTSELFGFPGMVFEVLGNGCVESLTVY